MSCYVFWQISKPNLSYFHSRALTFLTLHYEMDCTRVRWSRLLLSPPFPTELATIILLSNVKRVFSFNFTLSSIIRVRPFSATPFTVIWSLSRPAATHLLFFLSPCARSWPVAFFFWWTCMVPSPLFRVWAALFPFSTAITISTFWLSFITFSSSSVASTRITIVCFATSAVLFSEGVLALASARPRLLLLGSGLGCCGGCARRCFCCSGELALWAPTSV